MTASTIQAIPDPAPRIEMVDLSVHFEDRSALESINLRILSGETVSLVGPNGAGKSTLMRVIAGILPASHGTVLLDARAVTGPDPCIIYVPQRSAVDWTFPISVFEVVMQSRRTTRTRLLPFGPGDRAAALTALQSVGMAEYKDVQISRLSGGQQQRVFLARALLQDGNVYLMDEPFTGVDLPTQDVLVSVLHSLTSGGKTVIYATHDLQQAFRVSDRIVLLNRRILAAGPPGQVLNPVNLRQAFGGQAAVFAGEEFVVG